MGKTVGTRKIKLIFSLVAIILGGMGVKAHADADQCQYWTQGAYPVKMGVCSYPNGKSGYTVVTNNGKQAATICWTTVANNGHKNKSCHSNMKSGETDRSSAYQCGKNTTYGGCREIILDKYEVK